MASQMQVAAHVRQLKTFIVQLLLNYVGTKVSGCVFPPCSMLLLSESCSLCAVQQLDNEDGCGARLMLFRCAAANVSRCFSIPYLQHDMKLDTNYKLPRMRYKGAAGPQPQYIRAAPKQLITEVCCRIVSSFVCIFRAALL